MHLRMQDPRAVDTMDTLPTDDRSSAGCTDGRHSRPTSEIEIRGLYCRGANVLHYILAALEQRTQEEEAYPALSLRVESAYYHINMFAYVTVCTGYLLSVGVESCYRVSPFPLQDKLKLKLTYLGHPP